MGTSWIYLFFTSLLWLAYRVYHVHLRPVTCLEDILGIDVPPIPEISLSSITTNAVLLYYKPSDESNSSVKLQIQLNGETLENIDYSDGSIHLTGLQPGKFYGIRAIATNESRNSSHSRLIHIRTLPEDGIPSFKRFEIVDQRDHTKTTPVRRVSRPSPATEISAMPMKHGSDATEVSDTEESMEVYNAQLNNLRQAKDALELELKQEADEAEAQKLAIVEQRDIIKQRVEDQEKEHQERRKLVNDLEKQFKSSQRRKQAKDKLLQQKKMERQKMADEIEKWTNETTDMQEKMSALKTQKTVLMDSHEQVMQETRERIDSIMNETRSLEEEINKLGVSVNEGKRNARFIQDEEEKESERREQQHEARMVQINEDYRNAYAEYYQYEAEYQRAQEYRAFLTEDRMKNPARYAMLPGVEYNSQLGPARRNVRPPSRPSASGFSSRTHNSGVSFNSTTNPFSNGVLGFHSRPNYPGPLALARSQDIDSLTGGALVSPSANQLLPKDLLGDVDEDYTLGQGHHEPLQITSITQRSGSWDQDPQSPRSMHSMSHSALNSPHASFTSIPNFYTVDADGNSLHSASSPYHSNVGATADAVGPRRRSNIFGFGRQRPKSSVNELPPLGSLTSAQSHSFPLNDGEGTVRKKTGHSAWPGPVANFLHRGTSSTLDDDTESSALPRRMRRGLFGSKLDPAEGFNPYDRSASPRPPSTNSHDLGLPRPSSDSNPFGWMNSDGLKQRFSPLTGDWSNNPGPTGWSRNQSRRPSTQYGSTSNLPLGVQGHEVDEFGLPVKANQPAPIGTERFTIKSQAKSAPKLNPAAPSFSVRLFNKKEKPAKIDTGAENDTKDPPKSRNRGKNKNRNKDKGKDKTPKVKHVQSVESDIGVPSEDGSTSQSHASPRLSKDRYSYSQDDESQGSMLDHTPSNTDPSLLLTPTSATPPTKESLIQRLTRKSSSSKFGTAWKERGGLFTINKKGGGSGEPSTPGDVEEEDDSISGDYMSRGSGVTSIPDSANGTGTAPGTPTVGSSSAAGGGTEKEKPGRLSSSWGRVMSITGKAKAAKNSADKDDKERDSLEADDNSSTYVDE